MKEQLAQSNANKKVVVGMSGGVDSSVAAYLLLQQGYIVEGCFMKNWEEDDDDQYCAAAEDLKDAQAVADKLGIRLHRINFAMEYWDDVFEYFLAEYRAGRTPNPDIMCNKEIKFKAFLEYATEDLGADLIATGHYARTTYIDGHTYLQRGLDNNKDQSYFLHMVGEPQLAKTLFPVGHLDKTEVRAIAAKLGLITHDKKDSTGICFIGERKFTDFLAQYLPAQPGVIMSVDGERLGTHQGLMYHTIGQRKGLLIGGLKDHGDEPWYVVEKDLANNHLIVAQGSDHPRLFSTGLDTDHCFWINGVVPPSGSRLTVKTRYRQTDIPCSLERLGTTPSCGIRLHFDAPQKAVTPGQSAVIYQDDVCLGGGPIHSYLRDD